MSKGVFGPKGSVGSLWVGVNGQPRRVVKGYVCVGGAARQFYPALPMIRVRYTGAYTTQDVTVDGEPCTLWALTRSGTLTVEGAEVRVWLCDGGANGDAASVQHAEITASRNDDKASPGFGGVGGALNDGSVGPGSYAVTIGAGGGGKTSIGSAIRASDGAQGSGSGRRGVYGALNYSSANQGWTYGIAYNSGMGGGGRSTYPFGLSELEAHCAGGASGALYVTNYDASYCYVPGGDGGTNGGTGGATGNATVYTGKTGAGGAKGGGAGGAYNGAGGNATFYGGAGGGGGMLFNVSDAFSSKTGNAGGSGYQGVAYVLVPKKQEAK